MKHCPSCNRTYTDEALNFCLEDGTPLVVDRPSGPDANATIRYQAPRDTNPPPTQIYHPSAPMGQAPPPPSNQAIPFQPQWTPMPAPQPRKSNAVWWILGGIAVLVVLGIGIVVVIVAVASMSSGSNNNRLIANANNRNANTNRFGSYPNTNSNANTNANTENLPASYTDDFSLQKWSTGSSQYGDLWYADDEYHMRSKEKTYLMMDAPDNNYNTTNATVRVKVRNVDGISPTSGYGLLVHFAKSKDKGEPEDYGFLIYSGERPQYRVVLHKGGAETSLVSWTPSSTIKSGTSTNQIEVRIKGPLLGFYINGQYVTSIPDSANFKHGRAGFYTSDAHEVAFDDLEITR
jgi:hypothetical protein